MHLEANVRFSQIPSFVLFLRYLSDLCVYLFSSFVFVFGIFPNAGNLVTARNSSTADSILEKLCVPLQLWLWCTVMRDFISKRHNDISLDMWIRMEQMTGALA